MLLEQVFYNYYAPEDKERLVTLLKKHSLLPIIEDSVTEMSKLLNTSQGNPVGALPIAQIFANTLVQMNDLIFRLPEGDSRRELQQNTAQLGMRIMFYTVGKLPGQKEEILLALQEQFKKVSEKHGYDYKDIDSLLNLSPIISMMEAEKSLTFSEDQQASYLSTREVLLRFPSARVLNVLSFTLKQQGKINSRSLFEGLFAPENTNTMEWPKEDVSYLAYLFYSLINQRLLVAEGGKGYFKALEKLFTDEDGNHYPAERLKKLCFAVNQERRKFTTTKKEVDELVQKIAGMAL